MATRQWSIGAGGAFDFNNPANWAFGLAPGAIDIAQFNTGAVDTITGNATIAEILASQGTYSLAGAYTISGTQPTELSVTAGGTPADVLTILPGALVNGNQAVSVSGATSNLLVQGALVGSSLSVSAGAVFVYQNSAFDLSGPITISGGGALIGEPTPNQGPGGVISINNAIQVTGTDFLGSYGQQSIAFNGIISGAGLVSLASDGQSDFIALNGANTYTGGTTLNAANLTLAVGNAGGLGSGVLSIAGGELLATATETIANQLTMSGNFTIAAAHGQILTLSSPQPWSLSATTGEMINFGAPGQDGGVVFKNTNGGGINGVGLYTVTVQDGRLAAGDSGLSFFLSADLATVVQPGAAIDAAGFSLFVSGLQGAGQVIDSGAATSLALVGAGNFSGVISGPLALTVSSGATILSGANTYTGGTTINSGATLTLGAGAASGSVAGAIADNGTLAINRSDTFTLNNVSGTGKLVQAGPGVTILGTGLSYSGGTAINAGVLSVGNASALGAGVLTITGGELLASATETIANQLMMSGNFTIAAAHGQTLTTSSTQAWSLGATVGEMINFGASGQDGVIVFNTPSGSGIGGVGTYAITVQAGTLRAGDTSFGFLLENDLSTTVQPGAAIDAAGFSLIVASLQGGGQVIDSGAATGLTLFGAGNFSGVIGGPLALTISSGATILSGANTYTGGTTINSGATLTLGAGAASGSVTGAIADNGTLAINRSDNFALNNVSGTGKVVQGGPGVTILGSGLSYSGGTVINAGVLSVGNASALGAGVLTITGGELLATATETIANQLMMSGNFTIAAAHGQTLTTSSSHPWVLNASAGEMIDFGAPGQDGVIVFNTPGGSGIGGVGTYAITVQAGTLRAGDASLGFMLDNDRSTTVQPGAAIDAAGFSLFVAALQGGGQVIDSGAATGLTLFGAGNFSGVIGGPLALTISSGATLLSGANTYTGGTTINPGAELTLGAGGPTGSVAGNIADNGTLEFHLSGPSIESGVISGSGNLVQDGAGMTVLTQTNSYAGGTFLGGGGLELQQPGSAGSGAITFLSGTTSSLQIDGASMPSNQITGFNGGDAIDLSNVAANGWSYSGGVLSLLNGSTTVGLLNLSTPFSHPDFGVASDGAGGTIIHLEPPSADFSGNGFSGLLWQNSDGTPAFSEMNGLSVIAEGELTNPGPSWHLIGTGDFNGDGHSDLLWQNSDGTPAFSEMNGLSVIAEGELTNPGPSWHLIGTGDFNGDGHSDLLWQNSDGTPAFSEMNGLSVIAEGELTNPGPSWHLIGTGDFNGDGHSDLLWQNSDGTPAIMEMNGLSVIAEGELTNPGPSWHLIGTGDFNGDGHSDLLWQNSDGTPAIMEMNGLSVIAEGELTNPGPSWHLIGAGDFNGDGHSDLLWQNSDGTPGIWEMNGLSVIGSGELTNPGSSWHLIPSL